MFTYSLLLSILSALQRQEADPVKVTVYYESLCPDSIAFFTSQLQPTYFAVSEIMTVELHAYGKARDSPRRKGPGFVFSCQHGPDECYGNKVLGCGQRHIPDHDTYLNFTFCVMASEDPPSSGRECATKLGVPYDNIGACANSTEGEILLHQQGVVQSRLDPTLTFIPWIVINDVYSEKNLDEALDDLRSLVCETYTGPLPNACPS